jgi:hypothetical protein
VDHAGRLREIGDELYALPPKAFTAARDARATEATNAGDRETASAVAKMKRPSVAGWLVNLVALNRPDLVAELFDLGDTIRAAQGNVAPTQLRDLSAQRRRLLDGLLAQAEEQAAEAGVQNVARQHLAEAESTLAAAMADEETASLVRSGRVLKAASYSGFGLPVDGGAAAPSAGPPKKPAPGKTGKQPRGGRPEEGTEARRAEEERAGEERANAIANAASARDALAAAVRAEQEANERAEKMAEEIAQLRDRLEEAQRRARAARQARIEAERAAASAQRRLRRHGG